MYNTANVGIAAVIENNEGKVLLGLRKSKLGDLTWGYPGGKLEKGEEIETCITREVEETGMNLKGMNFLGITNDVFEDGNHFITIYMKSNDIEGVPERIEPDKCLEWKYFSYDELPDNLFLPVKNWLRGKRYI